MQGIIKDKAYVKVTERWGGYAWKLNWCCKVMDENLRAYRYTFRLRAMTMNKPTENQAHAKYSRFENEP